MSVKKLVLSIINVSICVVNSNVLILIYGHVAFVSYKEFPSNNLYKTIVILLIIYYY